MSPMSNRSSLKPTRTIITVASWEQRFILGIEKLIDLLNPTKVILFYYDDYENWSKDNREKLAQICHEKQIELKINDRVSFLKPVDSYETFIKVVKANVEPNELITLDITTMPREAIWYFCHFLLNLVKCNIQYTYFKPGEYADWLSRDPGKPRLLYKQSGIQQIGLPTALIVQTGFDVERIEQLERHFEPNKILLGLQLGNQLNSSEKNRLLHEKTFSLRKEYEFFDVNGFSKKEAFRSISKEIGKIYNDYNIVISSLGPKVGSLAIYEIKRKFPNIALCYTPSNEFNRDYSTGIQDLIYGILESKSDPD
jgi:hypothetical protein